MSKRPNHADGPRHPLNGSGVWSIGANSLTPAGQADLLKQLGRQLQTDYQDIIKEPTPDRLRHLLERLEDRRNGEDGEDP